MRIIFINRFFFPDESATSLMLTDLVQGLGARNHDIHVLTGAASYTDTADIQRPLSATFLKVTQLPTIPLSNQSLAGRVLNFLVFYCGLVVVGLWHIRRGDLVICLTDPPLVGVFAMAVAKLKRAQVVHWVQDIYPETATRLGYASSSNPATRALVKLRDWAWQNATVNVVIGDRMHDMLVSHGADPERIRVIQNWAGDDELEPLQPQANPLRREWGYDDTMLVVGYSGNLGRAHDADTMLGAAALLAQDVASTARFLFIGGGAKHARLQSALDESRLALMIKRQGYRPRNELSLSLNVPDVHWLSLEPELEGLIVPSKFYGAIAVGKPVIFIGDTDGEIARLIEEGECGASFSKGDTAGVAGYLSELAINPALRERLGASARAFSVTVLSRSQRLQDWGELVAELTASGSPYCSGSDWSPPSDVQGISAGTPSHDFLRFRHD